MRFLVVDDHESVLIGIEGFLTQQYPGVNVYSALTVESALAKVQISSPELVIMDLSIPMINGEKASPESGLQLLRTLLEKYPMMNIVVQSAHVRSLARVKLLISSHEGGFTVADKSLSMKEILRIIDWSLQGLIYTPKEVRLGLEVKPEWLEVLELAFIEGLQDKTIADRMCVSERTVRHYWTKIQDALSVYPEDGKNIRIQTEIRARESGLID